MRVALRITGLSNVELEILGGITARQCTVDKLVHAVNAMFPILHIDSGRITDVKLLQKLKAEAPISTTDGGIDTLSKSLQ